MLDDDWRPKLTRIEHPIADDYWQYVTVQGVRRISRLTIGKPAPWPKARAWYCPVMIEGYTTPAILPIFGSGPVDALMNGMNFVRRFFEENSLVVPRAKPKGSKRKHARSRAASRTKPRKAPPVRT